MDTHAVNGGWKFNVGQMVTHRDQPMPALVMTRHKAGRLGELYGVLRQDDCDVPYLTILGEVLVAN
ncbi:hypothetical protein EOB59_05515 [Mesorhizobium sp. M7A.F.Ca.MR.176.00.0.0]|uniref:hypothetical protein n=1 Tax=Mesorhizobium sp. M7A.F.Ca.MR.176.00.0.0 TaxID=2496776 RepID=UPI000FD50DD0|nr:hypothetical protein [Mesorhizobium sp. M7A.F.Ca.MR.176.00.0.0]RUU92817.1 hypothetical protein EOB59_05515 [Mesorhizobium sp. M7A.F.Ca.MR.176.00.0.0]